eukprot:6159058-Pleurochrysis_carterae.AAC.1
MHISDTCTAHMRRTRAQTPIAAAWNALLVYYTRAHVRRVRNIANHGTLITHTRVHAFAMRWRACLTACT